MLVGDVRFPQGEPFTAKVGKAYLAVVAAAAARGHCPYHHGIAHFEGGYPFAYLSDVAGRFMSRQTGKLGGDFPFEKVQVAVTEGGDRDFNLNFFEARRVDAFRESACSITFCML